ncbi:MAG: hypothetical protein ABIO06_09910 [Pseudolysinimonas sp.]
MNSRLASLILVPVAIVMALTACTTGGSGSGGSGGSGGTGGSGSGSSGSSAHGGDTRCVTGTWDLDVQGTGDQMLTYLSGKGIPISSVTGTGPITLDVKGNGDMTYTTGATYVFNAQVSNQAMVITQVQDGASHGHWAWAHGSVLTMDFSGWVNAITFTTTVTIGGQVANIPFDVPNEGPGSTPLTVHCTATSMTLKADASPFTLKFSRE